MGMTMTGRRLAADEVQRLLDEPGQAEDLLFGRMDGWAPELDLDKAWDGLHFVLARAGAERALLGADGWFSVGGGFVQARLVPAADVVVIADVLDGLDEGALRAGFDPVALADAGAYPGVWGEGAEEFDGYLLPALRELRAFYRKAADEGRAVLFGITT